MTTIFKTISILSLLLLAKSSFANDQYQQAMETAITEMSEAENIADYQNVINKFQRIGAAEKEEWLPYYYASLAYVYISFNSELESKQKDDYLDEAQAMADRCEELSPDNVEILVLNGYINMAKLTVNPALRGMLLTPKVNGQFGKAVEMDPNNPRANIMLARMKYGTAQFFNSSTDESCALAEKSLQLFQSETDRGILPHWGLGIAEGLVKACSQN